MKSLLEFIPLSTEFDVVRYLDFYEKKIKNGDIVEFVDRYHKTKDKIRIVNNEMSSEDALKRLEKLKSGIQENKIGRREVMDSIINKYTDKRKISEAPALEAEYSRVRKIVGVKNYPSSTSAKGIHKDSEERVAQFYKEKSKELQEGKRRKRKNSIDDFVVDDESDEGEVNQLQMKKMKKIDLNKKQEKIGGERSRNSDHNKTSKFKLFEEEMDN